MLRLPINVTVEAEANEMHRLSYYTLDALAENEPFDSLLRLMLGYWNSITRRGRLPRLNDLPPDGAALQRLQGLVTVVDVSSDDPAGFVISKHKKSNIPLFGQELENKRLVDFPCRFIGRSLAKEYWGVRQSGAPRYQESEQIVDGFTRQFLRLMLPIADENGKVVKVMTIPRSCYEPYKLPV